MKRLSWLVSLFFVFGLSGCFGEEADECEGWGCDEEVTLDLEKTPQKPGGETQEPVSQSPSALLTVEPAGTITPFTPAEYDYYDTGYEELEEITPDQLTPNELAKIDTLRLAISCGLDLGKMRYLEVVSLSLANMGVVDDYEGVVSSGFSDLYVEPEECPFAKYYDNGFEPTGVTCDYLVDLAKVEVYSELSKDLDANPLPGEFEGSEHLEESNFWYEQGAISGVEEQRVAVRTDLKVRDLCNLQPTPVESSYEKGVIMGRQLMAARINNWLASKGHTADYPVMSNPIQVCNADQSMLLPAKKTAIDLIPVTALANPLCEDYEPPTQEGILQYSQAKIDYEQGMKEGVQAEFAMAAVIVFNEIPCNVSDPIVLDLDGDGIELLPVSRGVDFDLYSTGSRQAIGWVAPDDGLLVLDRDRSGAIESGAELFGNLEQGYDDGFEHLAALDENQDQVLDARDSRFAELGVWKDANSNGLTEAGELVALADLGIVSVPLTARSSTRTSAGQRIAKVSFVRTNGRPLAVGDAFLTSAPYPRLASNR